MLIPEDYAQVNMIFSGQAVPTGAQVTVGITKADPADTLVEVADYVTLAIESADFGSLIENDSQMDGYLLKLGPNEDGPSGFFANVVTGDAGSAGSAPQVAALVRKLTGVGGRQGRGRLYWPFVMDAWVGDDGVLGTGEQGAISTAWNLFRESLEGSGSSCVLLHAENSPPKPAHQIVQFFCDGVVATQRRRLRR